MTDEQLTRDMIFLDQEFQKVVEQVCGVKLKHDRSSVARLDRLLVGQLGSLARDDFKSASVMTAAFLGETVRSLAGGHWHHDDRLGPGLAEVPGIRGFLRVLSRAERAIQSQGQPGETLTDFLKITCPFRA
jgi:hypothetical protein